MGFSNLTAGERPGWKGANWGNPNPLAYGLTVANPRHDDHIGELDIIYAAPGRDNRFIVKLPRLAELFYDAFDPTDPVWLVIAIRLAEIDKSLAPW